MLVTNHALPQGDTVFRSDDARWPPLGQDIVVGELGISWPSDGDKQAPQLEVIRQPESSVAQRLGRSMVPVHFFEPQRQAQIFFRRGVWRSARVMP